MARSVVYGAAVVLDAGNNKWTNLADGVAADDAATVGQLGGSGIPQGGPLTADLDADGFKVENAADPTAAQDYVTKAYGDANYGTTGVGAVLFDSTLVADTASIDTGAGGIAGGYAYIEVFMLHRTDDAGATAAVIVTVNNDTGAKYDRQFIDGANATAAAGISLAQTGWTIGTHGSGGTAGYANMTQLTIFRYAATTFNKIGVMHNARNDATAGNNEITTYSLGFRDTSAISRLNLAASGAAKLKTGSSVLIVGF